MTRKRVLSIGQCGPDHYSIAWTLKGYFGAEVIPASKADEAFELVKKGPFDLILVNRILDADRSSGLDVIKRLKGTPESAGTPVMLVSNLPEAQNQATAAGAIPGFGKDQLTDDSLVQVLRPQLG